MAADGAAGRSPRQQAAAALAALLLLLAALVGVALFTADRLYQTAEHRYVREAFPLRTAVRDLVLQMVNQETGVRGYILTADERSLVVYRRGRQNVAFDVADIERLTAGRPRLAAALEEVRAEIRSVEAGFARQIARVRRGPEGRAIAQAETLQGKARFDRFRAAADRLDHQVDEVVRAAQRQQRRTFRRTIALILGLGVAAATIAIALLLLVPARLGRLYRREREARLEAQRGARASRALAHVAEAVVLVDGEDVVRYWNAAAGTILGRSEEEMLGGSLLGVLPELAAEPEQAEGGTELIPLQVDGIERWFSATTTAFPEGRVVVLRDVTEERALERVRSDFVATAAHELRTPIAAVYGAARTLRREDVALTPELSERFLAMIESESERLGRIVDQILTSAALDGDELVLERSECDVRKVCESVLAAIEVWRPRNVAVSLVVEGAVAPIVCDEGRLRQVLLNIVENAIKYSPDGGPVELRLVDSAERVLVEVRDQGIGVPVGERDRIFEKFYRLDPSMSRGVGGSGLGLYISRRLIEQMGGSVTVRPNAGGGSVFAVELRRS